MKVLLLVFLFITMILFRVLAGPLGISQATALALWVAVSLFVARPFLGLQEP